MKRFFVGLIGCSLAVSVAACGSSSKSASTPTTSSASSATSSSAAATSSAPSPATGTPIVFGTNGSDHGNGFDEFALQDGFVAWAKQVSANGGIGGHPVTVERCNDQGSATTSATCARQQIADTKMIATEGFTPYSGFVSGPAYKTAGLAYIAPYPVSSADFSVLPAVTTPGTVGAYAGMPNYFAGHGYSRFGVIRTDIASTAVLDNEVKGGLVGTSGTFVADIPQPISQTDYSSAILTAKADKVDMLLLGVQTSAVGPIFQAAKANGYTGAFGIPGIGAIPATLQAQATTGVTAFSEADFQDAATSTDPTIVAFRAAMTAAGFPDSEIGQAALTGYVTGLFMGQVAKQAGPDSLTRASFLNTLTTATITGVPLFPASVSASSAPPNAKSIVNPNVYFLSYKDGKPTYMSDKIDLTTAIGNIKF